MHCTCAGSCGEIPDSHELVLADTPASSPLVRGDKGPLLEVCEHPEIAFAWATLMRGPRMGSALHLCTTLHLQPAPLRAARAARAPTTTSAQSPRAAYPADAAAPQPPACFTSTVVMPEAPQITPAATSAGSAPHVAKGKRDAGSGAGRHARRTLAAARTADPTALGQRVHQERPSGGSFATVPPCLRDATMPPWLR